MTPIVMRRKKYYYFLRLVLNFIQNIVIDIFKSLK